MEKKALTAESTAPDTNLFSRLRSCSKELYSLDTRPLIDPSFVFPWSQFSEALSQLFHVEMTCNASTIQWTSKDDVEKGLLSPLIQIPIAVTGVDGQMTLLISRTDVERCMEQALHVNVPSLLAQDSSFFDQFSIFFSASLVACAANLPELRALSPRLTTQLPNNAPGSLTLDIDITIAGGRSLGRLIIVPEFLESWKKLRLGEKQPMLSTSFSEVEVPLAVEGGRTFLTPHDLESIRQGDFLLLDHPFYIPDSQKSRIFLTHRGIPIFRAKVQEGNIKILEMPLQYEAFLPPGGLSMATQAPLPNDAEPDPTEATDEEGTTPDTSDEEAMEWEEEETSATPDATAPVTQEELKKAAEPKNAPAISGALTGAPIDVRQIPLTVVVELTELSMSIEKLTSLQPGNLLDLDIRPESGVSLVVNGKVIGRGEMMLIGDNVGVRITEIGFLPKPPQP